MSWLSQRPLVRTIQQPVVCQRLQVGKVNIVVIVQIAAHVAEKPQLCEPRKVAELDKAQRPARPESVKRVPGIAATIIQKVAKKGLFQRIKC